MSEYGSLIEYLLAYSKPAGGKLVKFGANVTQIATFPPNTTITITIGPRFGAYANIQYLASFSPQMVPNAFWLDSNQHGISAQAGFISRMLHGTHNTWIEITESYPITTRITNMTALLQYYEVGNEYLIIASEQDFLEVKKIMREWCSNLNVENQLKIANGLLAQIAGVPLPPAF